MRGDLLDGNRPLVNLDRKLSKINRTFILFFTKNARKTEAKQTPKEIIYKTSPNISSSDWAVPQIGPCYPLDCDVSQLEWGVEGGGDPLNKYTALDGPTVRLP